jgi:hypothetical protein
MRADRQVFRRGHDGAVRVMYKLIRLPHGDYQ